MAKTLTCYSLKGRGNLILFIDRREFIQIARLGRSDTKSRMKLGKVNDVYEFELQLLGLCLSDYSS